MSLTKQQFLWIRNVIDDLNGCGDDERHITLHTDYSGRAMYGRKCLGFSGQFTRNHLAVIFQELFQSACEDDPEEEDDQDVLTVSRVIEIVDVFARTTQREDSLGRDSIIYYPYIDVSEFEEDEEDVDN